MDGFKIIKRTDGKEIEYIRCSIEEIKYMPAKCIKTGKGFWIRLGKENNEWYMISGFKDRLDSNVDVIDTTQKIILDNGLFTGKAYSCPDCGTTNIVKCGLCGNITCYDNKKFLCAYCGNVGKVSGKINSVNALKTYSIGKK